MLHAWKRNTLSCILQCQWASMMKQSSNVFYSLSGHKAKSCGWNLWIGFGVFSFSPFPGLFLDMHSTVFLFDHIKQSWATTWQTKNIKGRCNAIIAVFTVISGSFEEGGDPINTLTNNSHQESIVAMQFRTLCEDTPPHSGHGRIGDPTFTPTVTLIIQYGHLYSMYSRRKSHSLQTTSRLCWNMFV